MLPWKWGELLADVNQQILSHVKDVYYWKQKKEDVIICFLLDDKIDEKVIFMYTTAVSFTFWSSLNIIYTGKLLKNEVNKISSISNSI